MSDDVTQGEDRGEESSKREPLMASWTKNADGASFSKSVDCGSPELASGLARKVINTASRSGVPVTVRCESGSVTVELGAADGKIDADAVKTARLLRSDQIDKMKSRQA